MFCVIVNHFNEDSIHLPNWSVGVTIGVVVSTVYNILSDWSWCFPHPQVPYSSMEQVYSSKILPEVRQAYSLVERYRLVSAYSLDSRMTGVDGRSEVVLEGSMDKNTWTVREQGPKIIVLAEKFSV